MEGGQGIFNLYQRGEFDPLPLTDQLGKRFEVVNLSFKPYPCCRWTHSSIDSALMLASRYDILPEEITHVQVRMSKEAYDLNFIGPLEAKRKPRTVVDAQFSVPYAVATALVKRSVTLDDFTEKAIQDPRVLRIAGEMELIAEPPAGQGPSPSQVDIKTKQGKVLSQRMEIRKGSPDNPMSDDELLEKFKSCAAWSVNPLPREAVARVQELILNLEEVKDMGLIPKSLAGNRR